MHLKKIKNRAVVTALLGVVVLNNTSSVYAISKNYIGTISNKSVVKEGVDNSSNIEDIESELIEQNAEIIKEEAKARESMEKAKVVAVPNVLNYASDFAGGDGSEESPYQISNALELARLSYLVNEGGLDTNGLYFELTADIDLSGFDADNDSSNGNWIPIGVDSNHFKGYFNGNNHTISNMAIQNIDIYAGLFGVVSDSEFKDVVLDSFEMLNVNQAGALVGNSTENLKIEGVSVSNYVFDYNSSPASYVTSGVIVAYVERGNDASVIIDNINVDDSSISIGFTSKNTYRSDRGGGIIGRVDTINNLQITNSTVDVDILAAYSGGVIADLYMSSSEGLHIENVDVNLTEHRNENLHSLGGIIGYSYISLKDGSDLVVEDCNVLIDANTQLSSDYRNSVGGVIGYAGGSSGNLSSVKCMNVSVDFVEKAIAQNIGGLIGKSLMSYNLYTSDCSVVGDLDAEIYAGGLVGDVQKLDCSNFSYEGTIRGLDKGNGAYVGGIVGGQYIYNLNVIDSNIKADIVGNVDYAGGVGGYIDLPNGGSIRNTLLDVNIDGLYGGGVIGQLNGSSLTIDSVTVGTEDKNANISPIIDPKFTKSGVGGMIALSANNSVTITNSNIYIDIEGEDAYIGGLIAYMENGNVNIDTVGVKGTLVGQKHLGGAMGNVANGDIAINNLNIDADIDTSNNGGYTGGVVGSLNTDGSFTIENSSYGGHISSATNSGGIIGHSIEDLATIDINNVTVVCDIDTTGNNTGGFIGYSSCKNINMSDIFYRGAINSRGYVGGVIGIGVANIDGARVVATITNNDSFATIGGVIGSAEWTSSPLELSNISVDGTFESENDDSTIGGLVGKNCGELTINNSSFDGSIEGKDVVGGIIGSNGYDAKVIESNVNANIQGVNYVGGICATGGDVVIENCDVVGTITSEKGNVGGLVGEGYDYQLINNTLYADVLSDGGIVGGLIGEYRGTDNIVRGNTYEGTINGSNNVGGLVGSMKGSCKGFSKNISKATIVGVDNVGGMVGYLDSQLSIDNNAFIGSIEGENKIGGIFGSIMYPYDMPIEVTDSYSATTLKGLTDVNSIIGSINTDKISTIDVYYDNVLSPSDDIYGIGLSTDKMQGLPTYENMDFDYDNIWFANKNYYPTFEQLNSAPEIDANDVEIEYGVDFDPMDYIISVDDFESARENLTINILQNTVNTKKSGTYIVEYEVVDESGLSTTKTINVLVKERPSIPLPSVNHIPTIDAKDVTIEVGSVFNPLDYVSATDVEDGDFGKDEIEVTSDVNIDVEGEYTVTYKVTDSKGAIAIKTIKVNVVAKVEEPPVEEPPVAIENEKPVINAIDKVFEVDSKIDLLEGVTAYDKEDGDLTNSVKIEESNVDINKVGVYTLTYSVTDSDGNKTTKTITVTIVEKEVEDDVVKVFIDAVDKVLIVGDSFNELEGVVVKDSEGGIIDSVITVVENTVDTTKEGNYTVVYKVVVDGVEYTKAINVEVKANSTVDNDSENTDNGNNNGINGGTNNGTNTDITNNTNNNTNNDTTNSNTNNDTNKDTTNSTANNEVVKTNDNIVLYTITLAMSMLTSIVLFLKIKKKED